MNAVTFHVPGKPQGKARAKTVRNKHTGKTMSYTPELIDGTLNPGQFVPESLMWIQLLWFHSVFERGLASRD